MRALGTRARPRPDGSLRMTRWQDVGAIGNPQESHRRVRRRARGAGRFGADSPSPPMRRLLALALLAPLAALAQPDPDAPTPLAPGTFELTLTSADGAERLVEGPALVHAYLEALGGWTLVLDDGADLVALERAAPPTLGPTAVGDARQPAPDDDARAYLRLADASAGGFSTGHAPPASPNRLVVTETDDDHTVGAFDFAAVAVAADGAETPLTVRGRFHALTEPDGGGDDDGDPDGPASPPVATSADCPDVWDQLGGIYGGMGSWTGFSNETNVGGPIMLMTGAAMGVPGWQLNMPNGCNPDFPTSVGYVQSIGHTATPLRAGIYRITNAHTGEPPGAFEVVASISAPYDRFYAYTSGYVWITSISDGRVNGTYSGYALPVPDPTKPPAPLLFSYGRFSARDGAPGPVSLPPGVALPEGVELPPGVELPTQNR